MDWMTLTIEVVGIAILCIWVVLPIREFAAIARRILPNARPKVVPEVSSERSKATPTPLVEILP